MTTARPTAPEPPETLESLIGDCRRMADHWTPAAPLKPQPRVAPGLLHGITVPPASAHAVSRMPDYGA